MNAPSCSPPNPPEFKPSQPGCGLRSGDEDIQGSGVTEMEEVSGRCNSSTQSFALTGFLLEQASLLLLWLSCCRSLLLKLRRTHLVPSNGGLPLRRARWPGC